jgi:hypothetical protein
MTLRANHLIECCDRGPTRWASEKTWTWACMSYATVQDRHPDLPPAMARRATACCLHFGPECRDEWLVREWRCQFEHAVRALATGFSGLPEPVDFLYTHNTATWFPPRVSRDEPVVVHQHDHGSPAVPYGADISATFPHELTTFILSIAAILKSVHDAGFVMRQLPLTSVVWNHAARRYSLRDGLGIAPIGQSNFHPRIGFPMVLPQWSAPECFDADAEITPASDVYAFGKTVLALLGHDIPRSAVLPAVHDAVEGLERRFAGQVPERIRRLLLLALHPQPHQRPRNMDDVAGMLLDGPNPVAPPTPPSMPPQVSKAGQAMRRRPPQKPLPQGPYTKPRGNQGLRRNRKGPNGGA